MQQWLTFSQCAVLPEVIFPGPDTYQFPPLLSMILKEWYFSVLFLGQFETNF